MSKHQDRKIHPHKTKRHHSEEFGKSLAVSGKQFFVGDVQGFMDSGELSIFEGQVLASVGARFAGTNPFTYAAAAPLLGQTWNGLVELPPRTTRAPTWCFPREHATCCSAAARCRGF
jgi:hypothetical protein